MSEYIITVPQRPLTKYIMEYNPFYSQDSTNAEVLHATNAHTSIILLSAVSKFKTKQKQQKEKKIVLPTLLTFRPKGQTFYIFRPYGKNVSSIFNAISWPKTQIKAMLHISKL